MMLMQFKVVCEIHPDDGVEVLYSRAQMPHPYASTIIICKECREPLAMHDNVDFHLYDQGLLRDAPTS